MALLVIYLLQIKKTLSGVYLQKRVISQNQLAAGQWIRPSCPEGSNLTSKSSWWKVDWGNKWGTASCFFLKFCVLVRKKSQRGKKALRRKELQAQMPFPFISAVQIFNAKRPWSSCSAAFNKDPLVVTTRSSTSLPKKVKRRGAWKPGISKCWLCGLGSITGWPEKKKWSRTMRAKHPWPPLNHPPHTHTDLSE